MGRLHDRMAEDLAAVDSAEAGQTETVVWFVR